MLTRKSFILHLDSLEIYDQMSDEQIGKLHRGMRQFLIGEDPVFDQLLSLIFVPFKNQFIRDFQKYSEFIDKQVENGKKGGRPKKTQPFRGKTQKSQAFSEKPKKAYSDNVSDSDNVSEKDNESDKIGKGDKSPTQKSFKLITGEEFKNEIRIAGAEFETRMLHEFFDYWSEPSPGGKMKFQLEKTWHTPRRLKKWASNQIKFQNAKRTSNPISQRDQNQLALVSRLNSQLRELNTGQSTEDLE